jgi:hypothetical protein
MYQPVIMASISRRNRPANQRQHPPDDDPSIPSPRRLTTTDREENNRLLIHPALEEAPHRKRTRIRRQVAEPHIPTQTMVTLRTSSDPSRL